MNNSKTIPSTIRRTLDGLYFVCGMFAAFCLVVILILIVLQMAARWTGEMFPGAPDYAGYFMAAASFFAFAYTLNYGGHIRVNMLLNALGRFRRFGEIWCFAIAFALSTYWSWFAIKSVIWSNKLGDISQGQDATPLWIPQMAMAVGSVVLTIAVFDNLVRVTLFGTHSAVARNLDGPEE